MLEKCRGGQEVISQDSPVKPSACSVLISGFRGAGKRMTSVLAERICCVGVQQRRGPPRVYAATCGSVFHSFHVVPLEAWRPQPKTRVHKSVAGVIFPFSRRNYEHASSGHVAFRGSLQCAHSYIMGLFSFLFPHRLHPEGPSLDRSAAMKRSTNATRLSPGEVANGGGSSPLLPFVSHAQTHKRR